MNLAGQIVHELRYTDCREEGYITISIHATRKGAEMTMEFERAEKARWIESIQERPVTKEDMETYDWYIKDTVIQE